MSAEPITETKCRTCRHLPHRQGCPNSFPKKFRDIVQRIYDRGFGDGLGGEPKSRKLAGNPTYELGYANGRAEREDPSDL